MDLSMPDLAAAFAVGIVGLALFRYGKRTSRAPHLVAGVVLMGSPYLAGGATGVLLLGGAIVVGLWAAVRFGL